MRDDSVIAVVWCAPRVTASTKLDAQKLLRPLYEFQSGVAPTPWSYCHNRASSQKKASDSTTRLLLSDAHSTHSTTPLPTMGGTSSRTAFCDIVKQLKSVDVDPQDQDFWDDLWKTSLSVEDIFELITPDDVRVIIADRPSNLRTLFTQAVAQLYQVDETPCP